MPEPAPGGGAGGKTRRPQPTPRLSLVLTKDASICPLYENLGKDYKALQDKKEEADGKEEEDMATTNKNLGKYGSATTGIRRSTLPVPLTVTSGNVPITRRTGSSGVVVATVNRPSAGRGSAQTSFLHHTFNAGSTGTGSTSSAAPPSSTLRCMPYNSPRLGKSSRFNAAAPPIGTATQNGVSVPSQVAKDRTSVKTATSTFAASAKLHRSEENLRSTNGITSVMTMARTTVITAPPSLRKPVITWRRRVPPTSSGDAAVPPTADQENGIPAPTLGVAPNSKTEYRKSASIPPLMVANLTSQFNALIERSQNSLMAEQHLRCSHRAKSGALVRTGAADLPNGSSSGAQPPSPVVAIQSCPSSPLHRSTFRIGRCEEPTKVCPSDSARPGAVKRPKDLASAATGSGSSQPLNRPSKEMVTDGSVIKSEKPAIVGELDGKCHKLTVVQRAIRNFEVTLTKSTSSPELPRKKLEVRASVTVSRQSQTLPTTNAPPPYGLSRMGSRVTATHTLPHFPCTSLPTTTGEKSRETAASFLTTLLPRSQVREVKNACKPATLDGVQTSSRVSALEGKPLAVQTSIPRVSGHGSVTEAGASERLTTTTTTSAAPRAALRTSLLNSHRGSGGVYQNAQDFTRIPLKSSVGGGSAENLFHARPGKIQNRKLPDVPTGAEEPTLSGSFGAAQGSSTSISSTSEPCARPEDVRQKQRSLDINGVRSVSSSRPSSKNSEVAFDGASDMSTDSRDSMDLLAEIDNDPQMIAAVASKAWLSPLSGQAVTSGNSEKTTSSSLVVPTLAPLKAPNASFLWKASTQRKVSKESSGPSPNGLLQSSSKESLSGSCKDVADNSSSDDDHVYEELFNCLSIGSELTTDPPPRDDVPLALPEVDDVDLLDDEEEGSPHEQFTYSVARRSLESRTTTKTSSSQDRLEEVASDGSWTDDSDNGDSEDDDGKSTTQTVKLHIRGKKQPHRKHLVRRSWSQSLRDLAQNQDGDAKIHTDGEGTWEEEMGSDSSSDHIYTEPIQQDDRGPDENGAVPHILVTDTDSDKSPTSVTSGSVPDVNKMEHTGNGHKGKRVKRNWSWSKTDFHLDLTKLGKIRMPKKPSVKNGGESSTTDESPTKKKQWPFRGKTTSKKGEKIAVPKQQQQLSPKKESALFYVPTVNADGSLASPPDHLANLDFQVPNTSGDNAAKAPSEDSSSTAITSVSRISIEVVMTHSTTTTTTAITITNSALAATTTTTTTSATFGGPIVTAAATKKARRISGGGSISRPKTAPPAPPAFAIKFTPPVPAESKHLSASVSVCSEGSTEASHLFANSSGQSRSISPAQSVDVHRANSDQSDSSLTRGSRLERGMAGGSFTRRSVSSMSSDSEVMVSVLNRFSKTRESMASSHSGSSADSYIQMDDVISVSDSTATTTISLTQEDTRTSSTITEDSTSQSSTLKDRSSKGFLYLDDTYFIDDDRNLKLSPFDDEPLYQFYNMAARQRAAHENQLESSDEDFYESPYQRTPSEASVTTVTSVPSAMDLVKSTEGGVRTLWCEVPEVITSGILDTISAQERKLQEAMFEVITSEASYLKSLNVLVNHFMLCPFFMDDYSLDCVLNRREKHVLFSDVIPVKETSERVLAALEKRWQENIFISDICDILQEHATKYFDVYVKYCSNQIYQDRCLKNLKETSPQFVEVLKRLESSPACQGLSMYSFLMLPMQRITRLPLLVDAIFNRLQHGVKQFETCKQALTTLNKIVHECNEGASRMARMEEMMILSRQLDFREFKGVALISASRWLVKKGELTRLIFSESSKLPFGRRCTKQNVNLYLFTDLLIITKKKNDDCYNVVDYCPRNMVQVSEIDMLEQLPDRPPDGCKNLFQLCMLQNHDNKTIEMFFCCPMESDRTRWMDAVTPKKSENPDERIYEEWDCPQVQAIHNYEAQQPDELSLEESDVVNVFRKMADGWYQGERIRDGVAGWFPSNYTVEIVSSHVRARNLRQRYRILALSQSYLEEQWKKENKGK